MKKKVVLTSASGLGYPSLAAILKKEFFVIGTASEKDAAGFAFVDKSYLISEMEEKKYIKDLVSVCKREKADVLLPVNPKELITVASNRKLFEDAGTRVLISSLDSLNIAEDKEKFFEFCNSSSIPFPEFIKVNNFKDFCKAISDLGYPKKDVCFKPKVSSGTRGFRIVSANCNRAENLFKNQPDSVSVDFSEICSVLENAKEFPELLVMEFLPGKEYSVDVLANKGEAEIIVPRTRDKIILGASFAGKTVREPNLIKYCKVITKKLCLDGVVGVQFKEDGRGVLRVLEVNPRVHGAVFLTVASGADIVSFSVKNALSIKWKMPKINWNTRLIRYYDQVYKDAKGKFFKI